MEWSRTTSVVGLCMLVLSSRAQTIPSRGQYTVSFKIVAGKLAIDRDSFRVAPSLAKFEPAIRLAVRKAVATMAPPYVAALAPGELDASLTDSLTQLLRMDNAWAGYISAFENWSAENPDRLDLGTIFSSDFLFCDLLRQTPDSGLILNEEDIDPLDGTISFSILAPFDSNTVRIDLPGMIDSQRNVRTAQVLKRLAHLNGSLWSSAGIRKVLAPLYRNLGLAPQILVLPRTQTIQIVEGPRIASIILPADQVPARDLDQLLWRLLDSRHYRTALRAKKAWATTRVVNYHRDLGYANDEQPYAAQNQLQTLQLLIAPLGYRLSAHPCADGYVNLLVEKAAKQKTRHLAGGFGYKPGQGFSALGAAQLAALNVSGGGPSGTLASASYTVNFLGFSTDLESGVSEERNRVLDGSKVNEQSTGELATVEWQPWRGLDGSTVLLDLVANHAIVFKDTLNAIQPGVQFVYNNFTSDLPSRTTVEPRILINARFADCIITASQHRSFDHWEYDLDGRFENAIGHPPIFELPSFGGAGTVRGFRADDAIGRRLWSTQNELWRPLPRWPALKTATFLDLGGAYQTSGSQPGLRAGLGAGLRLDLRTAVLKFDWAYGFGAAATGGSRGKFYFSIALNSPH